MNSPNNQKGFSLIEIIVAFSIAVMSLAMLYNVQSNAARASILYEEYSVANRIGKSLLAETRSLISNGAVNSAGSFENKYFWEVSYSDYSPYPAPETTQPTGTLVLKNITVEIQWQSIDRARSITINTLKPDPTQFESVL
ncbi:MAG: hypothetical protein COA71_12715 [SAR86 cluster bacterium]|uniref:Type II secretion system protein GspI n=1 Tax=SAR86 cluster bacterium TaxID=2030880 RepID=A0A2A5C819_9GAMM|nr:MAG: hypothetical protein COA71_12715 [SAR86 cluster bacterium]